MKKRLLAFTLSLILLAAATGSLTACGKKKSPREYLAAFAAAYPMPAGRFYNSEVGEEHAEYLPATLFDALFRRSEGDDDREDIRRAALFVGTSLTEIYEMGIFECPDKDCALEIIGCLETRLALLRSETCADASAARDAAILLFGRTVVYVVLPDNAKAVRTLERLF